MYLAAVRGEGFGNWVGIAKRSMNKSVYVLIVTLILYISLLPFAIYFALHCSNKRGWPPVITILLIISFFTPYIGLFTSLTTIILGLACI